MASSNLALILGALNSTSRSQSHDNVSGGQFPITSPMARSMEPLPSGVTDIRPFVIKVVIILTMLLIAFIITITLIFNSEGYNLHPELDIEQDVSDDMNRSVYISLPPPVFNNRNRRLSRALFLNLLTGGAKKRRAVEEEQRFLLGGQQSLSPIPSPSPSPDYGARYIERGRKKHREKREGRKHKHRKPDFEEGSTSASSASGSASGSSTDGYGHKGRGTRVEQIKRQAGLESEDLMPERPFSRR